MFHTDIFLVLKKPSNVKNTKMEGYLYQKNEQGRWKRRWVVLDYRSLFCFKKVNSLLTLVIQRPKICVQDNPQPVSTDLKGAMLKPLGEPNKQCFEVKCGDRVFAFDAGSTENYSAWTAALRDIIVSLVHASSTVPQTTVVCNTHRHII